MEKKGKKKKKVNGKKNENENKNKNEIGKAMVKATAKKVTKEEENKEINKNLNQNERMEEDRERKGKGKGKGKEKEKEKEKEKDEGKEEGKGKSKEKVKGKVKEERERETKTRIKKVIKIGGSCLHDLASIKNAISLISREHERTAIVVSALKGVTDLLQHAYYLALGQSGDFRGVVASLKQRHESLALELVHPAIMPQLQLKFQSIFASLNSSLQKIFLSREALPGDRARILSQGERLSAHLLAASLESAGIKTRVYETDGIGLVASEVSGKVRVNLEKFDFNFTRIAEEIVVGRYLPIFTGFFGSDEQGNVILFGRNSSDYSAAVIARGFRAERLELYKDVPGIFSSDPSLVPEARLIPRLSREEASLLGFYGARIIHPDFWQPLEGLETEILIKSFSSPENQGTIITPTPSNEVENTRHKIAPEKHGLIKGLVLKDGLTVLKIEPQKSSDQSKLIKLQKILAEKDGKMIAFIPLINDFIFILSDISAESLALIADSVRENPIETYSIEKNLALIAAVGSGINQKSAVSSRILSVMTYEKITPRFFFAFSENPVILILVQSGEALRALRQLHARLITSRFSGNRDISDDHLFIS